MTDFHVADSRLVQVMLPLALQQLRASLQHGGRQGGGPPSDSATRVLHAVYLDLAASGGDRQRLAAASESVRQLLVQAARLRMAGSGTLSTDGDEAIGGLQPARPPQEILALHAALEALESVDPLKAELAKLHYFVGLSLPQAGELLGLSPQQLDRHWSYARAWLHRRVRQRDEDGPDEGVAQGA